MNIRRRRMNITANKRTLSRMVDYFEQVLTSYDSLSKDAKDFLGYSYFQNEIKFCREQLDNIDIDEEINDENPIPNSLTSLTQPPVEDPVKDNVFFNIARLVLNIRSADRRLLKSEEDQLKGQKKFINDLYNLINNSELWGFLNSDISGYIHDLTGDKYGTYDYSQKLSEYISSEFGVDAQTEETTTSSNSKEEKTTASSNSKENEAVIDEDIPYSEETTFEINCKNIYIGDSIIDMLIGKPEFKKARFEYHYVNGDEEEWIDASKISYPKSAFCTSFRVTGLEKPITIIKTSVTSKYVQQSWNTERLLIDIIQNHLPSDSGGPAHILFGSSKNDTWYDRSEVGVSILPSDITKVKICDEGRGYAPRHLALFEPTKDENSAGKFGEGLKIAMAAGLNNGYSFELQSQNWKAIPIFVGQNKILDYIFLPNTDEKNPAEESHGSSTIISGLDNDACNFLLNVDNYVLYFNDKEPIAKTSKGNILQTTFEDDNLKRGSVYVKGLLIPKAHSTMYSYDFTEHSINNRDRDDLNEEDIRKNISAIFSEIEDVNIIQDYLKKAAQHVNSRSFETPPLEFYTRFMPYNFSPMAAFKWIYSYKDLFGERTAVCSSENVDPLAVHRAQHMGLKIVTLPDNIACLLTNMVGPNGEYVLSYETELNNAINNSKPIPREQLSDDEKIVIDFLLKEVAKLLPQVEGQPQIKNIEVYDYDQEYNGAKAGGFASKGDTISINRELFHNIFDLLDVFFHEATHAYTGAEDPHKEFRDFLTKVKALDAGKSLFPDLLKKLHSFINAQNLIERESVITEPEGGWADYNTTEVIEEQDSLSANELAPTGAEDNDSHTNNQEVIIAEPGGWDDFDETEPPEVTKEPLTVDVRLLETDTKPDELIEFANYLRNIGFGTKEEDEKLTKTIEELNKLKDKGYTLADISRALIEMRDERKGGI